MTAYVSFIWNDDERHPLPLSNSLKCITHRQTSLLSINLWTNSYFSFKVCDLGTTHEEYDWKSELIWKLSIPYLILADFTLIWLIQKVLEFNSRLCSFEKSLFILSIKLRSLVQMCLLWLVLQGYSSIWMTSCNIGSRTPVRE